MPAIAKKTYEELKNHTGYVSIFHFVLENLKRLTKSSERVELIHKMVDEFNHESFSHPLVKELSPCRLGCSACCHTQVSVTDDEADLLVNRIQSGVEIDLKRLQKQYASKNNGEDYFKLSYEDRKCIFLDGQGACKVYDDRPSVCRTNLVLGTAEQCDTSNGPRPLRLVRTPKSDMTIYASFLSASSRGSLPFMVGKRLDIESD